jgi:hypothetical protein
MKWWNTIRSWWFRRHKFKPGVFFNEELRLTEIVLEDTLIVWKPWGAYPGHAVDCGYDVDGRLVGIKIWDDVRTAPTRVW